MRSNLKDMLGGSEEINGKGRIKKSHENLRSEYGGRSYQSGNRKRNSRIDSRSFRLRKTTTLRMIAGFEHPEDGDVLFDGQSVGTGPGK